jgi:hypothetical protein
LELRQTLYSQTDSAAFDPDRPTKCAVEFNESLYEAMDENGKPVSTINEGIHRSVLSRYAGSAHVCSDDDNGTCSLSPYKPETLTPFFSGGSFAGLPIVD